MTPTLTALSAELAWSNNDDWRALRLATEFHEIYERLAPDFGYETRPDTKNFDSASKNGKLMTAVCKAILLSLDSGAALAVQVAPAAVWSAHDANSGMRFPEASDLTGGATDARPAAATSLEPAARAFIEHCATLSGGMVNGNILAAKASAALAAAPSPAPSPALPAPVGGPKLSTEHSMKSYLRNSIVIDRNPPVDGGMFVQLENGDVLARLDGFVVIPRERAHELATLLTPVGVDAGHAAMSDRLALLKEVYEDFLSSDQTVQNESATDGDWLRPASLRALWEIIAILDPNFASASEWAWPNRRAELASRSPAVADGAE